MGRATSIVTGRLGPYAISSDFYKVFADNLESLHSLAFLLMADETKAEACFVSGFANCVQANSVFQEWALSWARRTVVQNAVRLLKPQRHHAPGELGPIEPFCCSFARTPQNSPILASILGLLDFERFVFVLSVLCGYSDQECSLLLNCSRQDVREVRVLALQHIAESANLCTSSTDLEVRDA